ncbi:MAG: hypothetical protein ACR2LS_06850, partial [Thermomicrobiales bacterium]
MHRARMFAESRQAQDRTARYAANLEAVLETTRAVTEVRDLPDTLVTLADHLERLIPHERLSVLEVDPAGEFLRPFLTRERGAWVNWSYQLP